jgi:hypothetical protein
MSLKIGKEVLTSLLPPGDFWKQKEGGQLDQLYDATGDMIDESIAQARSNADIRDPLKTPILDDLEREYGILPNPTLTEQQRRIQLNAKKHQGAGSGTADDLQRALDASGFDLLVHKNDPAVDPAIFLIENFQMVAGGDNAYAGRPDAYAGLLGGYLLVNGQVFDQFPAYTMQAGGDFAYAGNGNAIAGRFDGLKKIPVEYDIPTDPSEWGFVFFVGGAATRDGSGFLTNIEQGFVPVSRQAELEKIILSIKPLYSWAGMIITYT